MSQPSAWKTPDEIVRLHRLKQRTKALQARFDRRPVDKNESTPIPESKKRKNPFVDKRPNDRATKKGKYLLPDHADLSNEDSIFQLLSKRQEPAAGPAENHNASTSSTLIMPTFSNLKKPETEQQTFTNFIADQTEDNEDYVEEQKPTKHLPVDWSLNTRMRVLTMTRITGIGLKTCQEASGITSFVRCLNPTSSSTGLDISPGARFHQATMYWQHPHLPWLTLFPRNAKSNNGFNMGEPERAALATDWVDSFRALFQLLRARQCPYFYVCANSFNVLFRAAGIGGRVETHAFLTPTSRGLRAALKQEDIEFTMPLKKPSASDQPNKSLDSGIENTQSTSFTNLSDEAIQDPGNETTNGDEDDDDEDQEQWLASLGVEAAEIRKISSVQDRKVRNAECEEDFSDHSVVLIEGVECQAFFNFLLNSKSTTAKSGRLAGVPPTLYSPVAFPGATLRNLHTRATQIHLDNQDYQSMELRGVILPHVLQNLCCLLRDTKDTFSASMSSQPGTISFCKASQRLIEDANKENHNKSTSDHVFGRENLSDCGLSPDILEALCRFSNDSVRNLERMCYNKEFGGYTWT